MSDNFSITEGSGRIISAHENLDGSLEQKVQITVIPSISISNFPATQPISVISLPLPNGASTEATLSAIKAKTDNLDVLLSTRTKPGDIQGISGSVSILGTIPVSGTFFQAVQPVSGTFFQATQPVTVTNPLQVMAAASCVSVTGATGAAVTATLPAIAASFHYITLIEIVKYFTVANAASATPLIVTTTNLPGSLAFTFGQPLGTIGTTDRMLHMPNSPIKSSILNTATTIVCPATTGIIWRINIYYFTAA